MKKEPAFINPLYVGKPNIGDLSKFQERLDDIFTRRWLTNGGKYVQQLEESIAKIIGVKHCVVMCNGTVALEIAIRGLGMKGEVILPSFTFIATAHALQWQEITPVFCDVDPATHNIDPRCIESLITPRTTGIIGVHLWGRACEVDALSQIAQKHHLKLLYDCAHGFGCSHNGVMLGSFGDAEVFSFHATKFFNTLEGGAVVTNDDALAQKMRLMKNFGFTKYDQTDYIGTNGKMNEVSAAMGITNLESMDTFIDVNHRNYISYRENLSSIDGIKLISYDETEKQNYQYIVLEIDEEKTGISRNELIDILHAENIIARRYFYPGTHRMEPYRSFFPHAGLLLPETERLSERVLALPNGTAIDENDIIKICNIIRASVKSQIN